LYIAIKFYCGLTAIAHKASFLTEAQRKPSNLLRPETIAIAIATRRIVILLAKVVLEKAHALAWQANALSRIFHASTTALTLGGSARRDESRGTSALR